MQFQFLLGNNFGVNFLFPVQSPLFISCSGIKILLFCEDRYFFVVVILNRKIVSNFQVKKIIFKWYFFWQIIYWHLKMFMNFFGNMTMDELQYILHSLWDFSVWRIGLQASEKSIETSLASRAILKCILNGGFTHVKKPQKSLSFTFNIRCHITKKW